MRKPPKHSDARMVSMFVPILPIESNPHPWGSVNEVELQSRCAVEGDVADLAFAVSCCDLTSLEGTDTPEKIRQLCSKAIKHSVSAVCVYPLLVPVVAESLRGSNVKTCSVAGGFPSGLYPIESRLAEIRFAVEQGADEIDIVMNRSAFLSGEHQVVYEEFAAMRNECHSKTMKVILETGDLPDLNSVRNACFLAMYAGADFIKTSTGKIANGATPLSALCIMEAISDFHVQSQKKIGIKLSGGIRKADDALRYITLARRTLGAEWINSSTFRIGASNLLDDLTLSLVT